MGSFLNEINFSLSICRSDFGSPLNFGNLGLTGEGSLNGVTCEVIVSIELIDSTSEPLPSVWSAIDGRGVLNASVDSA